MTVHIPSSPGAHLVVLQVDTVVFDKTGTLTAGHPQVAAVTMLQPNVDADHMLALAAAVERLATHPVAKAVVAASQAASSSNASTSNHTDANIQNQPPGVHNGNDKTHDATSSSSRYVSSSNYSLYSSSDGTLTPSTSTALHAADGTFLQEPGSGAVAAVAGHRVSVGTLEWVQRQGAQLLSPDSPSAGAEADTACSSSSSSSNSSFAASASRSQRRSCYSNSGDYAGPLTGHTKVYVGVDDTIVGVIDVADKIRADAAGTVQGLQKQGIRTVMLSGGCVLSAVFQ